MTLEKKGTLFWAWTIFSAAATKKGKKGATEQLRQTSTLRFTPGQLIWRASCWALSAVSSCFVQKYVGCKVLAFGMTNRANRINLDPKHAPENWLLTYPAKQSTTINRGPTRCPLPRTLDARSCLLKWTARGKPVPGTVATRAFLGPPVERFEEGYPFFV